MSTCSFECCILGAGPAGLATAFELCRHGIDDILVVDRNHIVGGLSRTENFKGARFDVGPHRFYTKNREINALWHSLLGKDFRLVSRKTRIFYNNHYFHYPLKIENVFRNLGLKESVQILVSFLSERCKGSRRADNYEQWGMNQFGGRLYNIFFKAYGEKVWGIPANQISAEWAAERIRGLDIWEVIRNAMFPKSSQKVKTLIDEFHYPILGAGQMYEAMHDKLEDAGGRIMLGTSVVACRHHDDKITSIVVEDAQGCRMEISSGHYFTSIPLTQFFKFLEPSLEPEVNAAAHDLYYRGHITVNLLIDQKSPFPDQWVYIHSGRVCTARISNYNNFSQGMSGNIHKTALSMEYFAFPNDDLWQMSDDNLSALAAEELAYLGLAERSRVENAWVVREVDAYPVHYHHYRKPYEVLKNRIGRFENVSPIGRGGLFKYNNQDHAALSGLFAARNFLKLMDPPYPVWDIKDECEYLEMK